MLTSNDDEIGCSCLVCYDMRHVIRKTSPLHIGDALGHRAKFFACLSQNTCYFSLLILILPTSIMERKGGS